MTLATFAALIAMVWLLALVVYIRMLLKPAKPQGNALNYYSHDATGKY